MIRSCFLFTTILLIALASRAFSQNPPIVEKPVVRMDSLASDSAGIKTILADSLSSDSTAARAIRPDSLKPKKKPIKPTPRISPDRLPKSFMKKAFGLDSLSTLFYEDLAGLLATLPGLRVFRAGDFGHPSFAGFQGDPPRFTRPRIDGMEWPLGVYGQTDFAALPEVAADEIHLDPETSSLNFKSFSQPSPVPWAFAEYAVGPFDVDVLRLRFQRRFSKKFKTYWGATFSNSVGQGVLVDGIVRGGPQNALKIYGRNEYTLNEKLKLRHRFIDIKNTATVITPFYFEELPEILDNDSRQTLEHNLHSLELAGVRRVADSSKAALGEIDVWKARVFYWRLSEQFENNTTSRSIKHQRSLAGGTFVWHKFSENFTLTPEITLQNRGIDSSTIALDDKGELLLDITQQWRPNSRFTASVRTGLTARESFDPVMNISSSLAIAASRNLKTYGRFSSTSLYPEPGEYANALDTLLQTNNLLNPMRMTKFEAGLQFRKKKLFFLSAIRRHELRDDFILSKADSSIFFSNTADATSYFSVTAFGSWTPSRKFAFTAGFDGIAGSAPDSTHYLFWYLPTYTFNFAATYSRHIFAGDIFAKFSILGRGFGNRKTPVSWSAGELPSAFQTLPARQFLDVEIKLFFRDAIIFLRFENLFGVNDAFWRHSQPMRGRFFRYGLNWTFWD